MLIVFFKVTVGKYYTASGRTTQIEGVKADILVPTYMRHITSASDFWNIL